MSTLRSLGVVALLASAVLGYASVVDRTHALALSVIELDSALPTPAWALALGLGLLCLGVEKIGAMAKPSAPAPRSTVVRPRAPTHVPTHRDGLVTRIQALPLPDGARLLLDEPAGVPLHLIVEEAPEKRVRRAVGAVGVLLAGLPLPPRLRVTLKRCPEPENPWHHVVAAALGEHLPRGAFRVVSGLDGVDVLFLQPDPSWSSLA